MCQNWWWHVKLCNKIYIKVSLACCDMDLEMSIGFNWIATCLLNHFRIIFSLLCAETFKSVCTVMWSFSKLIDEFLKIVHNIHVQYNNMCQQSQRPSKKFHENGSTLRKTRKKCCYGSNCIDRLNTVLHLLCRGMAVMPSVQVLFWSWPA